MKKLLKTPRLSGSAYDRRCEEYLEQIQEKLLPDHAAEFVAINMTTGEYALGDTPHEAVVAFRERWPDTLLHLCRVDGGPAYKFHGK